MSVRRVSGQGASVIRAPVARCRVNLVVDPILCDGHGVCAELFPERVVMDHWGYPIIDNADIPAELTEHALAPSPRAPGWHSIWWRDDHERRRSSR